MQLDPRFRFHAAQGLVGPIFTFSRIALWVFFIRSCTVTARDAPISASAARFLRRFVWPSSFYFLAYPFVLLLTRLFPPYLKHRILHNGCFIMQLGSMSWLSSLFLTKGDYFKVSNTVLCCSVMRVMHTPFLISLGFRIKP